MVLDMFEQVDCVSNVRTNMTEAYHIKQKRPTGVTPNKKPTNWWGRQNAAPPKFDSNQYEAALWTVFSNFHKC